MELTARESTSIPRDELTISTSAWPRDLDTIQEEITRYQEQGEEAFLQVGRLLLEARTQFAASGKWLKWLKDNTGYTPRTAQRLMRIARYFLDVTTPVSQMGVSKVYILCHLPSKEMDAFLKKHHWVGGPHPKKVKDMTKRELEQAVHQYLEECKGKRTEQMPKARGSPAASAPTVQERIERLREELSALSQLVASSGESALNEETAVELRDLCGNILQQLSLKPKEELFT